MIFRHNVRLIVLGIAGIICCLLAAPAMTQALDVPAFTVSRFVATKAVIDHEPVGTASTFAADTKKVFCFLEAREISSTTQAIIVWYYEDKEIARTPLSLHQGPRWRTFASKNLVNRRGTWKVEVQDNNGMTVSTLHFSVH